MTCCESALDQLNSHLEEAREHDAPREIIAEIEYQRDQALRSIEQEAKPDPEEKHRQCRRRRREERARERNFQQMVLGVSI
ncbi:hypothetical protein NP511_22675 (plasmid) [Natrinema thermotolerans]|uniref:Uncharacterized protein n=1 Tax=Natrinema thermotolerans TaxID=121872 RepID=A0AAF0PFR8_9EURY|nr:hypothetical protein [Natrinema thermotolerans]QCC57316.1 hypothetical protein DVR14_01155 [Natrinema thermotolerans]WMT10341.1 hypothetical protein NP511_22675 [Natrinema thermotolerans]